MTNTKHYIENLFKQRNIEVTMKQKVFFETFVKEEKNILAVNQILENQQMMIDNYFVKSRIIEIIQQSFRIPNGTVGVKYETILDFSTLGLDDLTKCNFEKLEDFGLNYNPESKTISGIPTQSGDFKIDFKFKIVGENEDAELNTKIINLIINADPKSLWKNIPSNKEDIFWKEDNVQDFQKLGDKHIVVSSKRGRSHANVGSFRDDDYAFKHYENTGWNIVVVSDGAGSAKASRKGSEIACKGILDYFEKHLNIEISKEFDVLAQSYNQEIFSIKSGTITNEKIENNTEIETEKIDEEKHEAEQIEKNRTESIKKETVNQKIGKFIYNLLGNAAKSVHNLLDDFAKENELSIKDLHSTLIFALFKKYEFGHVVMSFGVGDCPIGLLNKDESDLKLMNWLDVGEFGGGTRFITMPEIFVSDNFQTRFGFKLIEDFSYLMLMTDGIYDPKFVVEANLEKIENWKTFLADLKGENEDNSIVQFGINNKEIASQLSTWMDFWSAGNHDDRTLAIVF